MGTRTVVPRIQIFSGADEVQSFVLTTRRLVVGSAPGAHVRLQRDDVQPEHLVVQLAEGRYLEAVNLAGDPELTHWGQPFDRVKLGHGSDLALRGYTIRLTYVEQDVPTPPSQDLAARKREVASRPEPPPEERTTVSPMPERPEPPQQPTATASSPRLLVHAPDAQRRSVRLPVGSYGVGADRCEILVPFQGVASRHAQVTVHPDGAVDVKDLGSGQPTLINRRPITHSPFEPGDVMEIGGVQFSLEKGDAPDAPADGPQQLAGMGEPSPDDVDLGAETHAVLDVGLETDADLDLEPEEETTLGPDPGPGPGSDPDLDSDLDSADVSDHLDLDPVTAEETEVEQPADDGPLSELDLDPATVEQEEAAESELDLDPATAEPVPAAPIPPPAMEPPDPPPPAPEPAAPAPAPAPEPKTQRKRRPRDVPTQSADFDIPDEYGRAKRIRRVLSCLLIGVVLGASVAGIGGWYVWTRILHPPVAAEPTTGTQLLTWGEEGVPEWRRPRDVDLDPTLGSAQGGSATRSGGGRGGAPSTGMARNDSDALSGLEEMSSEIFMEEADAAAKAWIDVDAVEAVLRDDVTSHARMCHRQRAEVQPGLSGTMAVQIVIGTDGKVTAVYLDRDSSTVTDEELFECIQRAIRARGFPRAFGGPATLTYPFRFTSG